VSRPGSVAEGPEERPIWAATAGRLPICGHDHGTRHGRLDESQRRLDHPELAAARMLVAEGHAVTTLKEGRGRGATADFDVCGTPTEIKTLVPRAERAGGRPANDRSVYNRLVAGIDQGPVTIVMARGSGLRPADAAAGVNRFAARTDQGRTRAVRVVGDGWDLNWTASRHLRRQAERRPGRDQDRSRGRDLGLG
jgi:hypothetical protein